MESRSVAPVKRASMSGFNRNRRPNRTGTLRSSPLSPKGMSNSKGFSRGLFRLGREGLASWLRLEWGRSPIAMA